MTFAEASKEEQGKQPYKYNSKELEDKHGLNMQDYAARWKADWNWSTMDPLSEFHYNFSPYAYVLNNPLKYIDINGMDTTYVNPQGEIILTIPGGENVQMPAANDAEVEGKMGSSFSYYSSILSGISNTNTAAGAVTGYRQYTQFVTH